MRLYISLCLSLVMLAILANVQLVQGDIILLDLELGEILEHYNRTVALTNDPDAHYNLGIMYVKGITTEKDWFKALQHFIRAANQGYAPAIGQAARLSCAFEYEDLCLEYARQASDIDNHYLLFRIAYMYKNYDQLESSRYIALALSYIGRGNLNIAPYMEEAKLDSEYAHSLSISSE